MTYTTRSLALADCGEMARFLAAHEKIEDSGEVLSESDLNTLMSVPAIDMANFSRGIFDGETLVGVGLLLPDFLAPPAAEDGAAPPVKLDWIGRVGHDHRGEGIGAELLAWALSVAPARAGAERFRMRTRVRTADESAGALLSGSGFVPIRWEFGMSRALTAVQDKAELGDRAAAQLRLAPYSPELSLAILDAHNAAFADSWESPQSTPETWANMIIGHPLFRADLSFVFLDGQDRVAGLLLGLHNEAKFEQTGRREVTFAPIATRREWRGQGVASVLMQTTGNRAFELGFGAAVLEVDSENPTGALGVYRKAGFEVNREFVSYEFTASGA